MKTLIRYFIMAVSLWLGAALQQDALAWRHGAAGAQGGSVLNIPVVPSSAPLFANFMQAGAFNGFPVANWGSVSDTGFPNGTSLPANYPVAPTIPASTTSEVFVLDWTGSMPANALTMVAGITASSCTSSAGGTSCATNCISSYTPGANPNFGKGAGTGNANGTDCRVEFTFATAPTGAISSPNMFFNLGTAPSLTTLRLFRKRDETNNGGVLPTWNPDFLASISSSGTNSRVMRSMGNILNSGQENLLTNPLYSLRTPIGSISYGAKIYPYNQVGVGTVSLTGNNWLSSASYTGQPVNWTDKEVFQGSFQSAGTSTTVTSATGSAGTTGLVRLTVASTASLTTGQVIAYTGYGSVGGPGYGLWTITVVNGTQIDLATSYPAGNASVYPNNYTSGPGFFTTMTIQLAGRATAKPLLGPGSFPMGANGINTSVAGIYSCMYDGQFDAVICSPGGLYAGLSYELLVDLANKSNTDLWLNFSSYISDASVVSIAQMVNTNLNSALKVYIEYGNEEWNAGFYQYFLASKKAEAVGAVATPTQSSNTSTFAWAGLRSAQIFRLFAANWSGDPTRVKGVLNVQYAPGANGNGAVANEFNGVNLDPTSKSRLCSYLGGTFSGTCSGAVNYSASPNRPIDVTRVVSPAPYSGSKWSDGQYGRNTVSGAVNNGSGLIRLTLVDATNLTTGLSMTVQGVRGTTEANGNWTITKISSTQIDLQGSTFSNAYTGGGIVGNANYPFNLAVTYQSSPATALAGLTTLMVSGPTGGYSSNVSMSEWETTLTSYDATRPSGYGPLELVCYEGGPDIWAATVSDYTTMGLTSSATVTLNVGASPAITQAGHPYISGSKVSFSGGSGFTGLSLSQDYFVINPTTNAYDVSLTYYSQTAVVIGGTPTGTTTATGSTTSIDNLYEAWKNSTAASDWIVSYDTYFKTNYSHYKRSAMLQMVGNNWLLTGGTQNNNNRWSLYQNYFTPPATTYQFVNGLQQLH